MKKILLATCALLATGCTTLEKPKSGYSLTVGDCGSPDSAYQEAKSALSAANFTILDENQAAEMFLYKGPSAKGVVRVHRMNLTGLEDNQFFLQKFGKEPFSFQATEEASANALKSHYSSKNCKTTNVVHARFAK